MKFIVGALWLTTMGPLLFLAACNPKVQESPVATTPPTVETAPAADIPATDPAPIESAPAPTEAEKVVVDLEKGKRLYMSKCIQCHNRDPNKKGPIGPEMVDAPLEVMTHKVMTGRYPDPLPSGFTPKRKTKAMRPIPKLKQDIPDIHAWVQSVKK